MLGLRGEGGQQDRTVGLGSGEKGHFLLGQEGGEGGDGQMSLPMLTKL